MRGKERFRSGKRLDFDPCVSARCNIPRLRTSQHGRAQQRDGFVATASRVSVSTVTSSFLTERHGFL